jgi:hypothetical protein
MLADKKFDSKPISKFSKRDVEEILEKYGPIVLSTTVYITAIFLITALMVSFATSSLFLLIFIIDHQPLYLVSAIFSGAFAAFPLCMLYSIVNWERIKIKFKD